MSEPVSSELSRTQAVATAQRMAAGGWQIKEIRAYLASRGHAVSWDTAKGWADPEWAERRRKAKRDLRRVWWREHHGSGGFRVLDADARRRLAERVGDADAAGAGMGIELMLAFRLEDRLTYNAISKIAARIYGQKLSPDQIRDRLHKCGVPKDPSRVRSAELLNERKAA